MFNNRAVVQKSLFSSSILCWRVFVCYWICNGQRWRAYTSVMIARAIQAVCFIVYDYVVTRQCLFSVERTSRCIFFSHRDTIPPPAVSQPCAFHPPQRQPEYRKQFKLFIHETMQRDMRLSSKTAGFLGFSTFHFRPIEKKKAYISLHVFGVSFQWIWLVVRQF